MRTTITRQLLIDVSGVHRSRPIVACVLRRTRRDDSEVDMTVHTTPDDGGQAVTSAGAALFVLTAVLLLALADLGGHAVDRTRARTAADAAALAGLEGGRPAAARLARAHGATIVVWRGHGDEVEVEVRIGDVVARARATDSPD